MTKAPSIKFGPVRYCALPAWLSVLLVCLPLGFVGVYAQGSLVFEDHNRFGPRTIAVDSRTGLRWLTVTPTIGYSYNEIESEMSVGGVFEGLRHASMSEVQSLLESAGLPGDGWVRESSLDLQLVDLFISSFGTTTSQDGRLQLQALTSSMSDGFPAGAGIDFYYVGGPGYGFGGTGFFVNPDNGGPDLGHWLVAVPEPTVVTFVSVGFQFLLLRRCFRKPITP